ncbi:hypothetical protein [Paractinoplanes brasiliensis]|uniref:Uncharacterized protein n=1 Tax=Paractinoplanes brasiliensis TaxID=52695 RepID=A0A4R6JNZ5_9ACTN|nr:hypothetical protein [Actinoplanes brasiliensis]TDO37101.1 hypothetical protein C8E87_0696 [Actinoplanes brasiliensis]
MHRWAFLLLNAFAAMADNEYTHPHARPCEPAPDLDDHALVRAEFRSIVEREWGPRALRGDLR